MELLKKFFNTIAFLVLGIVLLFSVQGFAQSRKSRNGTLRDTVTIIPRSEWKAQEARPYKQHTPIKITVHHEGGKILTTGDDARQRLKNVQTWCMGPDRKWTDIPYHLLIAPDGSVYEGRSPLNVGETNTEYDPTGHLLICFLGNYSQQKLDDKRLKVLINLLADQCIKYNISPNDISTHRDHSKQTTCPGEDIYSYFKSGYIVDEVKKVLAISNIKGAAQIASSKQSTSTKGEIITGADQIEKYLPYLKGKRIGLVANQSSMIGKKSSVDSLVSLGIKIVKVFGPEHGFRGNASNGAVVGDEKDAKTGIPIISLYGRNEKPTKEQLADIDLMVFDIQDVGCRYYTNINTLEYVMEACAENNKELLILDRPNPNAYVVDGPVMTDDKFKSGIGIHYTPMTHGMTIGEFAQYLNGEGYLKEQCKINIIKVANYNHDMPYVLPISPSPNLNTQQAVMLFPSLCMFEGTAINEGRGTYMPFTILGAPALEGKYSFSYKPVSIPGMSENPRHKDAVCYGLDLRNYDINKLRKSRQINLSWLIELYNAYPDKANFFTPGRENQDISAFDLRTGTDQLRKQIIAGVSEADIRKSWEPGLQKFKAIRAKYLLYPD